MDTLALIYFTGRPTTMMTTCIHNHSRFRKVKSIQTCYRQRPLLLANKEGLNEKAKWTGLECSRSNGNAFFVESLCEHWLNFGMRE